MVTATGLGKGAERMEDYGKNMKKEMVDFVSYYRRFPNVAGKPSFSTLYTSINVLAGHYTSYGYKYPLPEKRVSNFQSAFISLLSISMVLSHLLKLLPTSSFPSQRKRLYQVSSIFSYTGALCHFSLFTHSFLPSPTKMRCVHMMSSGILWNR